jgi:hypothetical protein
MALSHTITFVYTSVFIGGIFLAVTLFKLNRFKTLKRLVRLGSAYLLSWILALYFLAPLITQQANLEISKTLHNPYAFNWLTPLPALLAPTALVSEPPQPNKIIDPNLYFGIGWLILGAFGVVLYHRFQSKRNFTWTGWLHRTYNFSLPLLVVFVIAFVLTWSPVDFWQFIPKAFHVAQFSYRILAHIMWVGALLAAYALVLLFKNKMDARFFCIGLIVIALACSSYLPKVEASPTELASVLKTPMLGDFGAYNYIKGQLEPSTLVPRLLLRNEDNTLTLNVEQKILAWYGWKESTIVLEGVVPENSLSKPLELIVVSNGKVLIKQELKEGKLNLSFPLTEVVVNYNTISIGFTLGGPFIPIQLTKLEIKDSVPERKIVPVSIYPNTFKQEGTLRVGTVSVAEDAQWVQLPILYQPSVLDLRVNGQKVTYYNSYQAETLLSVVALRLAPGNYHITSDYVGYSWANWVCLAGWLVWIIGVGGLTGRKLFFFWRITVVPKYKKFRSYILKFDKN